LQEHIQKAEEFKRVCEDNDYLCDEVRSLERRKQNSEQARANGNGNREDDTIIRASSEPQERNNCLDIADRELDNGIQGLTDCKKKIDQLDTESKDMIQLVSIIPSA
jgi:archaellum component FlaC